MSNAVDSEMVDRAQGSLLGQLIGDALGSQVEFMGPEDIAQIYPEGVSELRDGGTWDTLAGQPTDDSEMALLLARSLVKNGSYDEDEVWSEYEFWLESDPFDVGGTIEAALSGHKNYESQANGALMRVSPLGIFGAMYEGSAVAAMARADAELTHPNPVCLDANALYARAIAFAVQKETTPDELYEKIVGWSSDMHCDRNLKDWIASAEREPPKNYTTNAGWVKIALWNALYQLLHASDLEEALVDTVMRGGDTDTNAAITGALLGAVHGRGSVPDRWLECIENCRPDYGVRGVRRPRPEVFWPVDALELAEALLLVPRR